MGIDDNNSSSSSTNHIDITMEEEDALEIGCKPDCSTNNDVENNNDKPERFFYIFFSFFFELFFTFVCFVLLSPVPNVRGCEKVVRKVGEWNY